MIDCLSNPNWIGPQTDFLLFLQNYRCNCSDLIDKFFLSITTLGEFWIPTIICAVTYWCIDFKAGMYLFSIEGINVLFAHFFKMIAGVYRPWILDNRIKPSELAVPFAKGYSFPSGHSAMSSSVLGGCAFLLRKNKILCISLILLILLVGFSRLWLGVHTPQDVVVGLSIGLVLIFAGNKIINWAEQDNKRYIYLALIVNLCAVLALIYIKYFNICRLDYIDGELLVNPQRQLYAAYVAYGYALGILNGSFLCRRFIPFNPKSANLKVRITRGIIGIVCIILLLKYALEYVIMNPINPKCAMLITFVSGFFITFVYPFIFIKIEKFYHKGLKND